MITAVWLAREINQRCGGALIAPWQVEDLPDEWAALFEGLALDLPALKQTADAVRSKFAEFRAKHPTYQKY